MSAAYKNLVNTNRVKLETVIPLKMPFSIFIDPCETCNFRCNFCAMQDVDEKLPFKKQVMDFELFKHAVDDMKAFPERLKMLRIALQGEPLLNPMFPDMVRYAKEANVSEWIETVTNGSKLNPDLNQRIVDAGIDRIRISIESISSEGYAQVCGVKLDLERFLDNIRDLHERSGRCEIYCKIVDISVPSDEDKKHFAEMFEGICDKMFIDNVSPVWAGYDKLDKKFASAAENKNAGLHGQVLRNVNICPIPFYTMAIHADGSVSPCCADWRRRMQFGNIKDTSLSEIWNGEKLRRLWRAQAQCRRKEIDPCNVCLNPVYDCADYLDPYKDEILKRLTATPEEEE